MERRPTGDTNERATANDETERDLQAGANDVLSSGLNAEVPGVEEAASELAQDGVRPGEAGAGPSIDDPLGTERPGLDVFQASEVSGDPATGLRPASTTDRFGGAPGTDRDASAGFAGEAPGALTDSASGSFGPGFDSSLGNDDAFLDGDGSRDGSPPALPGSPTDDPSTVTDGAEGGTESEATNSSQPLPEEPNSSQPEDAPEPEPNWTPDQLESSPKPPDETDIRQVAGRILGRFVDPPDEDDDGGRDGGAPRAYEAFDAGISTVGLRTEDEGNYVNPSPGDPDLSFSEAAEQLARAHGPGMDTLIDVGMDDYGNAPGNLNIEEAREDVDPMDPELDE